MDNSLSSGKAKSSEKLELLEYLLAEEGMELTQREQIPSGQAIAVAPLSFAQQRWWFLERLQSSTSSSNLPAAVRLIGALDIAALEQGLNTVVRRHAALRTRITLVDGQPVQQIALALTIPVPVVDLQAVPQEAQSAEVLGRVETAARLPFDLSTGPLLRATVLRLNPTEHVLLLNVHHIVFDGWSLGVFLRELALLYTATVTGSVATLPELPIQYADFAIWQRDWLQGDVLARLLDYWRGHLADAPVEVPLPTDFARPNQPSFQGALLPLALPHSLSTALAALSRQEGVTLFMTLLAAFQVLLHRYTDQDDIVIGTPIAGRTRVETEGLIGLFLNTQVLRTNLAGNPSFRTLLGRVRAVVLGAQDHQELPFERLVVELAPERTLRQTPLFNIVFIMRNAPLPAVEVPGLTLRPFEVDTGTAKYDLTLSMLETADGLKGVFEYRTALFEAATIQRMAGHFTTLLQHLVAAPHQPFSTLSLLTSAEQQLLIPIGRPLASSTAYVLDAQLQPVPIGVVGDVYLTGLDHLGRPDLTAEQFVPNPFLKDEASRMIDEDSSFIDHPSFARLYKTGERARYRADGTLERLGRRDQDGQPAPAARATSAAPEYLAPRTPLEAVLAAVWAEVLSLERVGIHDNFFQLGGHSLLAMQVIARIHEVLPLDASQAIELEGLLISSLFEQPTIAALAETIEHYHRHEQNVQAVPLTPVNHDQPLPLSFGQERQWFLQQLEPESVSYNIPAFVRVQGSLNVAALEQSLHALIERHAVLRTTFVSIDGQPMQQIAPSSPVALRLIDLRHTAPEERETQMRRQVLDEAQQPFDLAAGPLIRTTLLRLDDQAHILLILLHHSIADGWSIGVLIRDIAACYSALVEDLPIPLPALPIQYADYAVWQRQWLQGDVLAKHLEYWQNHLAGAPVELDLPADYPRPAVQSTRGAKQVITLSVELTAALEELSRREGVTLFMTLLAAFSAVLARISGQDDLVLGTPVAGRRRAELERLIGFFVNTLAVRIQLTGNPPLRALLLHVRQTMLGAYTHQDLPFEKLVEALVPDRDLRRTPLFQVMFVLQNTPMPSLTLPGLSLTGLPIDNLSAKFDITLETQVTSAGLHCSAEYCTDLFQPETISRLLTHFELMLAAMTADLDQRVEHVAILPEAERRQLLYGWNDNRLQCPNLIGAHQLIERHASRTPEAIAVTAGEQSLRYADLDRRANQLAHYLRERGVGPEVRVGICLERSVDLVVAVLAVLKAGGAYIPLDPAYPQDRLAFMLEDALVAILLTQQHLTGLAPQQIPAICLDTDWRNIAGCPASAPANCVDPDHLAYIIYTSGSTNRPKGVMVTHGSLVNAYAAWTQAYALDTVSTCHLQMASFSFDVFIGDVVRALGNGARLVLCPRDLLLEPARLYAFMRREAVDTAEFVPAVVRALVSHLEATDQTLEFMRVLVVSSDSWTLQEYARLQRVCGPATRVINAYGITEATVDTAYYDRPLAEQPTELLVPIGRPMANMQMYVLDRQGRPAPIGVIGELYIGGAGVTRGYLGRPDLTAERFVPNPFADQRLEIRDWRLSDTETPISNLQSLIFMGTRLYKTGDRARYRADGVLEFWGRADQQIKLRGFRIEPGEIEAVLEQHPAVQKAVVLVYEHSPGSQTLVAYLVTAAGQAPAKDELRDAAKAVLPPHMVPSFFVLLDALPLTPNGKIDRRALPAPIATEELRVYIAPRDDLEHTLAGIWCNVLGLERAGIHDNFFDLGGHSMLIPQLIFQIHSICQVALPLRMLFNAPTIAELAQTIRALQQNDAGALLPQPAIDLGAEVVLDPEITCRQPPVTATQDASAIFLTGATGFLGAYLLRDLLAQTNARIFCLVRAQNAAEGLDKLRRNLAKYQLWDDRFHQRITIVAGDLAQPRLGLAPDQFHHLAQQIDLIYHCGAQVNFLYPYEMLRSANVAGTQEVLRLATTAGTTPVHFISTLDVFAAASYAGYDSIAESDPLETWQGLANGYAESKWVAEKIVRLAQSRGLPVAIYRPGLIGGHSRTGINNTTDLIWNMIKSCIQLGSAPDTTVMVDMVPVDYVSTAIVALSRQPQSPGKAFHLINSQGMAWKDLIAWLRSQGYPVARVPYERWRAALLAAAERSPEHPLAPFMSLFAEYTPSDRITGFLRAIRRMTSRFGGAQNAGQPPQGPLTLPFDWQNTRAGLANTTISCPPVDDTLLRAYFTYFTDTGFLDRPGAYPGTPPTAETAQHGRKGR